jgi:hypothetical protein
MASRDQRRQAAGGPPGGPVPTVDPTAAPDPTVRRLGRRHLLGAAGMTAVSLAAMAPAARAQAQNTTPPGSTPGTTPGAAPAAAGDAGAADAEPPQVAGADLVLARFARSVELALVEVYAEAIDSGRLKSVAADQAHHFQGHHKEQAEKLAEIGGSEAPNSPNAGLLATLTGRVDAAANEAAMILVLQAVEESAAATYLGLLADAEDWQLATTFSTIAPVDAQQAVAWSRLGEPDPAAWAAQAPRVLPANQTTDGAWSPAQYPAGAA